MIDNVQFQKIVKTQFENWVNDENIINNFCGDETAIKKAFLFNIQTIIDTDFVILTNEELMDKMQYFHNCMEGMG